MSFGRDDAWQRKMQKVLRMDEYYDSLVSRGILAGWRRAKDIYEDREFGDVQMQLLGGRVEWWDEKFVRWPGYWYTALTVETWSCPRDCKWGWGLDAGYARLLHIKVGERAPDERSARCTPIDFGQLKDWLLMKSCWPWRVHKEDEINETESLIVPYEDMIAGGVRVGHEFSLPIDPELVQPDRLVEARRAIATPGKPPFSNGGRVFEHITGLPF